MSSNCGQGSLDSFVRSGAGTIAENSPQLFSNTRSLSPAKCPHKDSDPESGCDEGDADTDRMDFQHIENVTATHMIGDEVDHPEGGPPQLPPTLSPEHAALHSDFEIITMTAMEQLYIWITANIEKSACDTTMALCMRNDQLRNQITSLGARITQLQQQVLTYQGAVHQMLPVVTPPKKDPKKKKEKQSTSPTVTAATGHNSSTYAAVATAALTPPVPTMTTNTTGWTTLKVGGQKDKKIATSKLIPTTYPQAEWEVTCYFVRAEGPDVINTEQDYTTRQISADAVLRRVNAAIINNKVVFATPFIRAQVTMRGNIIFTTGNTQNNVIYEDYTTIIADALSYYGECEKVEIGKQFSQFLLHGVPTHLFLPEISQSLATKYPQLVLRQTPWWLTPADRWEHKANSTIVMTLTGKVKKADVGRQHLIVCNRQCQLGDYIAYGWSTRCLNCQTYSHPAALCQNNSCCAVCADLHETKEHPCVLPICKKGPTCTHPPIRYTNCDAPHKASDPNCLARIKLHDITKTNTNTVNKGDAPMAGVTAYMALFASVGLVQLLNCV